MVEEGGQQVGQVAWDLGIHDSMLRRWRDRILAEGFAKFATDLFPSNGKLTNQDAEIRRLRREVQVVRQENAFLKKRRRTSLRSRGEVRSHLSSPE